MKQLLKHLFHWQQYVYQKLIVLLAIAVSMALFTTPVWATGLYDMPSLKTDDPTWIVDEAEVISRINEGNISSALGEIANQTGYQVRIVIIRRLDYDETANSFTQKLFEKWFPTPEAQANQALLMLDVLTNKTAFVTGDGIKSVMSDDIANSVVSETLMVPLRDGNRYNQAILDASDRIITVLSGKPDPGPPEIVDNVKLESNFVKADEVDRGNATAWVVGLLIAATIIPMATYYVYQVNQPSSDG
ncbi:photosystem II repair protein Psb32 [Calothrix rhizosoleniae]|uniref:photosystem II repair protein Psb32 n=1 Tax=Calothrix rhizosoleniae TaxID=888997 RepID=UPI000B4A11B9|nr:TPM domain-containing protein [Calothrix rhizosoleniae]